MHTDPAKAGFDPARLERITAHLERNYIESGKIPGCQVAVSRHGQPAYFRSFGNADRERFSNTRIFRVHPLLRFSVFPIGNDDHLPHHLFPLVPHYNLKKLHELLLEIPEYRENATVVRGYFVSPEKPPVHPTVLDLMTH